MSCLVNSYNYRSYVVEAVRSALAQTRPFDEIVVVDDGSTDGSPEALRRAFAAESRVVLVEKDNEGQLSCFHRGLERATGDLLFFLDADDLYEPRYLETILAIYRAHPESHFVVSAYRTIGKEHAVVRQFDEDRDLGFSAVLALTRSLKKLWVSPTSTLSARRSVLERFLPLPQVDDWRTRADDCLLFGSALAGARKYYSAAPLVCYRVHGENCWYGRGFDEAYEVERSRKLEGLIAHLLDHLGDGAYLADRAHEEFGGIASPTLRQLRHYVRIALRSPGSRRHKAFMLQAMLGHFLRVFLVGRTVTAGAEGSANLLY